ncbi:aldolase catalytic domain-containing protein [bacterium]|nr:aldolase catalytic domain-containing protein [bacterium]
MDNNTSKINFLDCTLRDGGYYTNWDFSEEFLDKYLKAINLLPIDYIEIGYRNKPQKGYYGEFYYLPIDTMRKIRQQLPTTKIAVMIDEKSFTAEMVGTYLSACQPYCDMIRMTVKPDRIKQAVSLAHEIKKLGFEVALNLMYISKVEIEGSVKKDLALVNDVADYFYVVDSYGGIFPQELKEKIRQIKEVVNIPLGYHGHNNQELAFINTIAAIEEGVTIVDATITGMGRGAGNLKTELFLTYLDSKLGINVDEGCLSEVVNELTELQKIYGWGTNYLYMLSGANSLPQKDVMDWITKKRYPLGSIIQALLNKKDEVLDNLRFPYFSNIKSIISSPQRALIIGGGTSVERHQRQIRKYLSNNPDVLLIFSSSRNLPYLRDFQNSSLLCIVGNEGNKLVNRKIHDLNIEAFILPPYPRTMGSIVPSEIKNKTFELNEILFTQHHDSPLSISLQVCLELGVEEISVVGFDGYLSSELSEVTLGNETQKIITQFTQNQSISSYTPTLYNGLIGKSIYEQKEHDIKEFSKKI